MTRDQTKLFYLLANKPESLTLERAGSFMPKRQETQAYRDRVAAKEAAGEETTILDMFGCMENVYPDSRPTMSEAHWLIELSRQVERETLADLVLNWAEHSDGDDLIAAATRVANGSVAPGVVVQIEPTADISVDVGKYVVVLTLKRGNVVVASVNLSPSKITDDELVFLLFRMWVRRPFRGQGLGTQMLTEAIKWFNENAALYASQFGTWQGLQLVTVAKVFDDCPMDDDGLNAWYVRHGFVKDADLLTYESAK